MRHFREINIVLFLGYLKLKCCLILNGIIIQKFLSINKSGFEVTECDFLVLSFFTFMQFGF